jgi:NH3-dependent NAD+ synthetase
MNQKILEEITRQNYTSITNKIEEFIDNEIKKSNYNGVIFGLSGGLDSAVLAHICKRSLEEKNTCTNNARYTNHTKYRNRRCDENDFTLRIEIQIN